MHGMMAAHHHQQQQQQMIPREPSPPPKPDGSECHRSQSAIFTRMWNRGEGNSCSRTDMIFKPVPDSKLARKREERIRKASDREEAMKAVENAGKRPPSHPGHPLGIPGGHGAPPHPLFSPTNPGTCPLSALRNLLANSLRYCASIFRGAVCNYGLNRR